MGSSDLVLGLLSLSSKKLPFTSSILRLSEANYFIHSLLVKEHFPSKH